MQIQQRRENQRPRQNHKQDKIPQDELPEWYDPVGREVNAEKYAHERPGHPPQQPGGDNKKDDKSDLGLAGVAIITLEGSETGPFDIIVGGVALSVYLAQNSKHVKEVMDGLAAQIEKHLGKLGSTSNPDPKGGWKDEIRAARERMQRLSKRLGDKARQNYREIMDKAAKALEQDLE